MFQRSFEKQLPLMTEDNPRMIMKKSRSSYRDILRDIPDFDKDDRFLVNILIAAMLAAVYLNLSEKPCLDAVTAYYHKAMTESRVMRLFLTRQDQYSAKAQAELARQAEASRKRSNPYTCNSALRPGRIRTAIPLILIPAGFCICFKSLASRKSRLPCAALTMTWRSWAAPSSRGSTPWRAAVPAVIAIIGNKDKYLFGGVARGRRQTCKIRRAWKAV